MATGTIASLAVRLRTITGPFENGLKKAERRAKHSGQKIERNLGGSFRRLAGLAAGMLGGAGIVYALKRTGDEMDKISKSADRLNISTEALAGLQFQAGQAGVSTEQLSLALTKMQKRSALAAEGNESFAKAYREIGVSAKAVRDAKPEVALGMIADGLNRVENPAKRTALSMQLLGDRAGPGLRTLLKGGSAAIEEYRRKAQALGLTFSREVGAKVEAFNDALDTLRQATVGLGRLFVSSFAPVLAGLANVFDGTALSVEDFGGWFTWLAENTARALRFVLNIGKTLQVGFARIALSVTMLQLDLIEDMIGSLNRLAAYMPEMMQDSIGMSKIMRGLRDSQAAARFEVEKATIALKDLSSEKGLGDAFFERFEAAKNTVAKTRDEIDKMTFNPTEPDSKGAPKAKVKASPRVSPVSREQLSAWEEFARRVADVNARMEELRITTINTVADALGGAFQSAIQGARSASDAFVEMGRAIAGTVVGALVRYGVQLALVSSLGPAAVAAGSAATAAGLAAVTATTAAASAGLAAAWAPAALAASIATLGGAAASGSAAYLSALAIATAATVAAQGAASLSGGLFGAFEGAIKGQAHDGLARVPSTGTYLLKQGEAVYTEPQHQALLDAASGAQVQVINQSGAEVRAQKEAGAMRIYIREAVQANMDEILRQARLGRGPFARAAALAGGR